MPVEEDGSGERRGRCVLVVDEDAAVVDTLVRALGGLGYTATGLRDGSLGMRDGALGVDVQAPFASADVLITELVMRRVSGLDLIRRVRETWSIPIIAVSAFGDQALREQALEAGAVAVLHKPFYLDELVALVDHVCASNERR